MIGRTISHFKILEKLGEGGFGVVYKARDLKLDRIVALKFLSPELTRDSAAKSRFINEAKATAALSHPNICTIFEVDEYEEHSFLALECYKGETLKQKMEKGPLPLEEVFSIIRQVASGLAKAHENGIIHRDIKPANIFIMDDGLVKILDFGLARLAGEARLTKTGTTMGTVAYLAPEQARGERVDHRADIWALGVTLYEALQNSLPFKGDHEQAVLYSILFEEPDPCVLDHENSDEINAFLRKCLAKDVSERWQNADDLLETLDSIFGYSDSSVINIGYRKGAGSGKSTTRRAVLIMSMVIVPLLVLLILYFNHFRDSKAVSYDARRLTMGAALEIDPDISPDGKMIAYAAGYPGNFRIMVKRISGGKPVAVAPDLSNNQRWPRWAPDGEQILFQAQSADPTPGGILDGGVNPDSRGAYSDLYVVNYLGGRPRKIIGSLPNLTKYGADWSSDSGQIAFSSRDSLYVYELASESLSAVYGKRSLKYGGLGSVAWSHDCKRIAFGVGSAGFLFGDRLLMNVAPSQIWLADTETGHVRLLLEDENLNMCPRWSSDDHNLLFISSRGGIRDVYRMSVEQAIRGAPEPERLTTGMSPLSIDLVGETDDMVVTSVKMRNNLWAIDVSGLDQEFQGKRQVTSGEHVVEGSEISENGRWLYFDSGINGNQDIFRMDLTSGDTQQITFDPTDDFYPCLSPDGEWMAYYSMPSGIRVLCISRSDGRGKRILTRDSFEAQIQDWSPDGKNLLVWSNRSGEGCFYILSGFMGDGGELSWSLIPGITSNAGKSAEWSGDGRFIVFSRMEQGERGQSICVVDSDGTKVLDLPISNLGFQRISGTHWSEDGTRLYFLATDSIGDGIWSIALDDGRLDLMRRIESDGRYWARLETSFHNGTFYFSLREVTGDIWLLSPTDGPE
jgi:serine/threonine protein kinase